jgi:hypothetical protein
MKTYSSQLYFHGLASGKSIHKISDRLWSADRSRLCLILNKNWRVHSLTKLIIFDAFVISKHYLRAVINESQNRLISFHVISGLWKTFQRQEAESSLHQCKKIRCVIGADRYLQNPRSCPLCDYIFAFRGGNAWPQHGRLEFWVFWVAI